MASSYTTNVASSNLVGRELGIASTFVKQYYTLLNKAPCFIHNFYSQESTFIHGTVEMAQDGQYTEPAVGRDKIRRKMEDLKLIDCRAKIKQIDCLETLAGGLVIQVIGELSNNGKPMRRFLQTFVLAPSPNENGRQDGDGAKSAPNSSASNNARGGVGNGSEQSHNQKFFVLNSIFRYQDDGPDSEFEDDGSSVNANTSVESASVQKVEPNKMQEQHPPRQQQHHHQQQAQEQHQQQPQQSHAHAYQNSSPSYNTSNGSAPQQAIDYSQNSHNRRRPQDTMSKNSEVVVDRLAYDLDEGLKLEKQANHDATEPKRENSANNGLGGQQQQQTSKAASGVTGTSPAQVDKKIEAPEKVSENSKVAATVPTANVATTATSSAPTQNATPNQSAPTPLVRPQPSNEPKTWANMVRNSQAASSTNVNKPPVVSATTSAAPSATGVASSGGESQVQSSSNVQSQQQQSPSQQQQHQASSQQGGNSSNNNNNNQNNNRRRHMMRKPSNNNNPNNNTNNNSSHNANNNNKGVEATGRTINNNKGGRPRPPQGPRQGGATGGAGPAGSETRPTTSSNPPAPSGKPAA